MMSIVQRGTAVCLECGPSGDPRRLTVAECRRGRDKKKRAAAQAMRARAVLEVMRRDPGADPPRTEAAVAEVITSRLAGIEGAR